MTHKVGYVGLDPGGTITQRFFYASLLSFVKHSCFHCNYLFCKRTVRQQIILIIKLLIRNCHVLVVLY